MKDTDPLRAAIRAELMHPSSPVTSADQADALVERIATKVAAIKERAKEESPPPPMTPEEERAQAVAEHWLKHDDPTRHRGATDDEQADSLARSLLRYRAECLDALGLDESGAPAPPCDFCQSKDHGANDCPHDAEDREMPDDRFEDEPSLVLRVHNLAKRLDESVRSLRNEDRQAPGPTAHGLAGVFEAMAQELRVGGLYGPYTEGDGVIPEKDTRPLVVIESPYAGDTEANLTYARRAMDDSLGRGENPIASHLLYTQPGVLNDDDPEERQRGIDAGLAWGAHANAIAFYTDLGMSPGMRRAEEYWRSRGKQIVWRSID